MIIRFKKYSKILYIFFATLSLFLFFFSTDRVEAKSFNIENIEVSKPFEINFDKALNWLSPHYREEIRTEDTCGSNTSLRLIRHTFGELW